MAALAAQNFLPAIGDNVELIPRQFHGEDSRRRIANGQTFAVVSNPVTIGNAHTRRCTVPGENNIAVKINGAQIRQLAVIRIKGAHIIKFKLLNNVGHPSRAETFPCQHINTAYAQH